MPTRTSYDPGTPCWIDLISPDVDASADFYTRLLGWTAVPSTDPSTGQRVYTNLMQGDGLVAGMAAQGEQMAGMPATWASYVCVEDVAQTLARAEEAGGTVMIPAMQVMDQGWMGLLADPTGAAIGLWQPGAHIGATVCNDPGTWSWNELMTRDIDAALAFYSDVFGWTYDTMDMGGGMTYHVIHGGDAGGLGGLMAMPSGMPDQVPDHWGVYFTVDDADATAARCTELGGRVVSEPADSDIGRMAALHDPQGGSFSIMQPNS